MFSRRGAGNAEVTGIVCKVSIVLIVFLCALCASARERISIIFLYGVTRTPSLKANGPSRDDSVCEIEF